MADGQVRTRASENLGKSVGALLRLTAAFEASTAVALLALPALMLSALFGHTGDTAFPTLLARLVGASLLALSVACWAASYEASRRVVLSQVAAMLLYNGIVAALLGYAGTALRLAGVALWPAILVHILLAGWCVAELVQERRNVVNTTSALDDRPRRRS